MRGNIFVSCQHTDVILWYDLDTMEEKALPLTLQLDSSKHPYYPSTFYQFGYPHGGRMPLESRQEGARGIIAITTNDGSRKLWSANEDISGIMVIDILTGLAENFLIVECPISMYHWKLEDGGDDRIYVGSSTTHSQKNPKPSAYVSAFNYNTMEVEDVYSIPEWHHPTGIFVNENILYVAEQQIGAVFGIDIITGESKGQVIKTEDLPHTHTDAAHAGVLEGMMATPC